MKKTKEQVKETTIVDATKSPEDRRRAERLIKNHNFMRGSKYIPNGGTANDYRYKRKPENLLN